MKNLKIIREKIGLNQSEVAKALNISRQSYNFYENGKRDPDTATLSKLADYFSVTTDYLLGKSDNPDPQELVIPEELKNVRVAFHRGEFEDLTQDEVDALAVIARTLKAQRKGAKKDGQT